MQLIAETRENLRAFELLEKSLKKALGKPRMHRWSFPDGGSRELPTYRGSEHLTVGVSPDHEMKAGAPILIKIGPFEGSITPTVELNIPIKNRRKRISRDGRVNGCFARDDDATIWLCHRGIRLTVNPSKIPKNVIHRHFQKWLVSLDDNGKKKKIIPVAPLESDELPFSLAHFGESVRQLKESWAACAGNEEVLRRQSDWFEDINFSDSISKFFEGGQVSHKYLHGPIQRALQQYLRGRLNKEYRAVLNKRIDLGIARGDRLVAIFEVKTGSGSQIYSGIGQLLIYRQFHAQDKHVPLFLVVPAAAFEAPKQQLEISGMLQAIGMTLVLQQGAQFHLADGRELHEALEPKWL